VAYCGNNSIKVAIDALLAPNEHEHRHKAIATAYESSMNAVLDRYQR